MSSEDYLIRQLRQLAVVLARILGLNEKREHVQALETIDQTLDTWYKIDPENPEEKLHQDKNQHSPEYEEEKAIAELFYQRAKTLLFLNQSKKAIHSARVALSLFKTIDEHSGQFSIEIQERIAELSQISKYE